MIQRAALLMLLVLAGPASAQQVSTSASPQALSVTIYRGPGRSSGDRMDLAWLKGFALITETRRVSIPAGDGEIRFEGVAGGIVPASAIVTGLPDGVIEKNQDAHLLSPASLLDSSFGRRVMIRRTSRATGVVREQQAIVRTGRDGAVVLQTAEGFEALRCTGLPETIVYGGVPEGLSAKPVLSVRTRSARAASATVTLSYLSSGFDWQANYVGTLSPDGDRLDLFAWVTLANGDETGFVNAGTQVVAGWLNREETRGQRTVHPSEFLRLTCWPAKTTSDIPLRELERMVTIRRSSDTVVDAITADDIGLLPDRSVTEALQRVPGVSANRFAQQEELGDLKLYRIPEPVTVASNSEKQVALLARNNVKVESFYRVRLGVRDTYELYGNDEDEIDVERVLKAPNREQDGLGLPLPAGSVAVFGAGYARPVLLGEGSVADKAVGEDVEFVLEQVPDVQARLVRIAGKAKRGDYRLTVSNDRNQPVRFDAEFQSGGAIRIAARSPGVKFGRRNGRDVWSVTVPANGTAQLLYHLEIRR